MKNLMKFLFSNDGVVFVSADSDIVISFSDNMGLVAAAHNNVSFDDDYPKTNIHVRLMVWCNAYMQHKACQKIMNYCL